MVIGVVIGNYAPGVQPAFDTVRFNGVSIPIAIGLLIMMWPILTKVQYETLPKLFSLPKLWMNVGISMFLNWIVGPLVMVGLAWATLPDLPGYRTGVILVGLARCIAMVMIWNQLAQGNSDYCAILVVINSILQIILYSPYALTLHQYLSYGDVAISVLIYLGIPLAMGIITRLQCVLALVGLLYTIIVMFAYQGRNIVHHLNPVFRVFVPMILYFLIMWSSAFAFTYFLYRKGNSGSAEGVVEYEMAVVQAFTAGSNNFELAIAVAIAVYGVGSEQALAATIGPLVEVPVLLALTWLALWLRVRIYQC
ncbi:arsenical-resistance protein [Gymnopus androsaceus JB14]|uniref:Arsenical-resistance protein n=1 Tax=Gymnopus androsaceus JB14 TaxID=1447944 RepID=A0A6A4I1T4_9AGAR|nr:arsenical-resistance protein [Gymnopus androsaceus JB14]